MAGPAAQTLKQTASNLADVGWLGARPPNWTFTCTNAVALQARKLEGELDVKLASYGKLCSGFEAGERGKGPGSAAATDQVCNKVIG